MFSMRDYVDRELRLALRDESMAEIGRQTGIDPSWLGKYGRGEIPNPGLRHMETLAHWLHHRRRRVSRKA